jgi:predicted permease
VISVILFDILGPILVLVLLGAWTRWRFKIDVGSLSKLNIYLFVPAFFFDHVVNSNLALGQALGVVLATVLQVAILGGLVWLIGRAAGASRGTIAAMAMCVMFYNSGNYGLALSDLAYPAGTSGEHNGPAAQAFVVFCQNFLNFSVGLAIAGSAGGGSMRDNIRAFLRMPTLYTITVALLARWWRVEGHDLPKIITSSIEYLSKGLVPVALVTLGAQLAVKPRWPRWKPVAFVLATRLVYAPLQMIGLLFGAHLLIQGRSNVADLWPWPAENLVLTAGVPTAVNTLLVTLEMGGDAELTADCVFWTTVFSAVTITAWLIVIRSGGIFG